MQDDSKAPAGVKEGDTLAGKYRIDKVLGTGGMGVVVAAHHIQLDEKVAIKFLLPQALASTETVARFAREARAAVKIKSEHVARVTDVGTLESGAPFMVMEYLQGSDLSDWIQQRGALPIEQAAEFVLQACEAVAEAHALGIVHRDLKPSNLFVTRRPDGTSTVKVLDFGISKTSSDAASMGMTATSSVMGSPLYMSPEQMQSSKDVDARSDIWAIGIILYELLTGDSPFQADTMPKLVLGIMSSAPPPLRNKRPDAPKGLEQVILKCLEKDRGKRFQSVAEFAQALYEFAPRRSRISVERIKGVLREAGISGTGLALAPSSEGLSESPPSGGTGASWGRTATDATSPGARKFIFMGLGAAAILAVILVVVLQTRPSGPDPASSATSASPGTATAATVEAPAPSGTAAGPEHAEPAVEPTPPSPVAPAPPATTAPKEIPKGRPQAAPPTATKPGKPGRSEKPASQPSAAHPPPPPPPAAPAQPASQGNSWGGRL
jgi:serine/threonine-protein kinase